MSVVKDRWREIAMWALLALSGTGTVAVNAGGAALAERCAKLESRLEAESAINGKRLDRIETKIDELLQRK